MNYVQLSLFSEEEKQQSDDEADIMEDYDLTELFERLAKSDFRMNHNLMTYMSE